jgi:4-amino-4-deoxy-L-arabinose transferase-like glycosyltransferase
VPAPLALLLLAGAVLSAAWSVVMAPLQGFDEAEHVAYAIHLAETGGPPQVLAGARTYTDAEGGALGPLGYGRTIANPEAKPPFHALQEDSFRRYEDALGPGDAASGSGPNPLGKNPPLYYAYEAIPYRVAKALGGGFFDQLALMRLWSGLLFLGTIACAWLLAGEVFRRTLPKVTAAGFVALHPLAAYITGIVNTDAMLMLWWTAFLWLALRLNRLGPSPARVGVLAATAAGSVLTHGRGLAILPVLAVVLAVVALRHRPSLRTAGLSGAAALACVGAAFVVLRTFTSAAGGGGALFGGEVNLGAASRFSIRQLISQTWQFYLPRLRVMEPRLGPDYGFGQVWVETYFGGFASYDVAYPRWIYDLISLSLIGTLVACIVLLVRRGAALARARWDQLAILLAAFGGLVGFLHVASYRALVNGSMDPLVTGRYLLPITGVLALAAGGLVAVAGRRGPYLAGILLVALLGLSLAGLGLGMERFYA